MTDMHTRTDLFIHQQLQKLVSRCQSARAAIQHEKRITHVVRHATSIHAESWIKALARRDTLLVQHAAERRLDELIKPWRDKIEQHQLDEQDCRAMHDAYRVLCGNFPRQAYQVRGLLDKAATLRAKQKEQKDSTPSA